MGSGFCGCSLGDSTITAIVLTILDSIFFLAIDWLILIALEWPDLLAIGEHNGWKRFIQDGFQHLYYKNEVEILLCIRISVRIVWAISALLMIYANKKKTRPLFIPWQAITILKIFVSMASTAYALVFYARARIDFLGWMDVDRKDPSSLYVEGAQFITTCVLLDGTIIWLSVLVSLLVYVYGRGLEIKKDRERDLRELTSPRFPMLSDNQPIRPIGSTLHLSSDPHGGSGITTLHRPAPGIYTLNDRSSTLSGRKNLPPAPAPPIARQTQYIMPNGINTMSTLPSNPNKPSPISPPILPASTLSAANREVLLNEPPSFHIPRARVPSSTDQRPREEQEMVDLDDPPIDYNNEMNPSRERCCDNVSATHTGSYHGQRPSSMHSTGTESLQRTRF